MLGNGTSSDLVFYGGDGATQDFQFPDTGDYTPNIDLFGDLGSDFANYQINPDQSGSSGSSFLSPPMIWLAGGIGVLFLLLMVTSASKRKG